MGSKASVVSTNSVDNLAAVAPGLSPACRPQGRRYIVQPIPGHYFEGKSSSRPFPSGKPEEIPLRRWSPRIVGPPGSKLPGRREARMFMIINKVIAKWSSSGNRVKDYAIETKQLMQMRFGVRKKMLNIQVEPRICLKTQGLKKMRGQKCAFSTGGFAHLVFPRFGLSRGQIPVTTSAFEHGPAVRPATLAD